MATAKRIASVLVVDDRRMFAEALAEGLATQKGLRSAGVASHLDATDRVAVERPDVVLVDPEIPGVDGRDLVRALRAARPEAVVLVVLDRQSRLALAETVEAGAAGYVRMRDGLATAAATVRRAAAGERLIGAEEARTLLGLVRHRRMRQGSAQERADRLTRRELEILQHMADGLGPDQMSFVMGITSPTLRTHMHNILMKLSVRSKTEALAFAIRHGKVTTAR
jgi:DNA-binding NarL/FixJ family response regulator